MEKMNSKKRKQIHIETFNPRTRSILPRTRSGLIRQDRQPKRSKNSQTQSSNPPRSNPKTPIDTERISVKDLRARRIFSPSSIDQVEETEKIRPNEEISKEDQKKGGVIEIRIGKSPSDDGVGEKIQSTSPERTTDGSSLAAAKKDQPDVAIDVEKSSPTIIVDGIHVLNKPLKEFEKALNPISSIRSGAIVRCSRSKLYKNPSSFSYKRLLPFITDLAKEDNINALEVRPSQKIEKLVEERNLSSLSVNQDIRKDISVMKHPLCGSDSFATQESTETALLNGCSKTKPTKHSIAVPEIQKSPQTSVVSTDQPLIEPETQKFSDTPTVQPLSQTKTQMPPDASDIFTGKNHVRGDSEKSSDYANESSLCSGDGECFQSTPPDIRADGLHVLTNLSSKERLSNEKEKNPNSKSAVVQRTKLYKNLSSFSYRRLLPFLTGLTKENNSNALEIRPCEKIENSVEATPTLSLLVAQGSANDVTNDGVLTLKCSFSESDASPNQAPGEKVLPNGLSYINCSDLISNQHPLVESDIQNSPDTSTVKSSETPLSESKMPLEASVDSKIDDKTVTTLEGRLESTSEVQFDMSNISYNSEPPKDVIIAYQTDSLVNSHSLVIPEHKTESMPGDPSHILMEVNGCTKLIPNCSGDEKITGELDLHQNLSHIETLTPLEKLASDPSKGILKRYPRGCRGLCNCLNCASFRLHAERTFEFSRNQMQDAEELAMGLMKELSHLQILLEKSVEGDKCDALLEVSQIKEAISEASTAQELAKCRLQEMNYELNIHCRTPLLQRPRVRFAQSAQALLPVTRNFEANNEKK